ncbi:hypothetical protein AKJ16_DCAP06575 [Drosera capensis]
MYNVIQAFGCADHKLVKAKNLPKHSVNWECPFCAFERIKHHFLPGAKFFHLKRGGIMDYPILCINLASETAYLLVLIVDGLRCFG